MNDTRKGWGGFFSCIAINVLSRTGRPVKVDTRRDILRVSVAGSRDATK